MDRRETASKVSTLIRLGETAEQAYDRALPKIADPDAARRLALVRAEHRAHADAMRSLLEALGEDPQPHSADFEWFAAAIVERVGKARRLPEVLARTRQAEAAVLIQYADAADAPMPLQVGRLVRRHLARNEAHLDLIDEMRGVQRGR
jgi:hypothetical protein